MNWKPSFAQCFVMSFGLALLGCGTAADSGNEVSSTAAQTSSDAADGTLVTLDLPGMT